MNKIKAYISRQVARPMSMLAYDTLLLGGFLACIYFGWVR